MGAGVQQDVVRGLDRRLDARGQDDVGLGHREPQLVRGRDDGRLDDRGVLDEDALELERADLVVGGLEDVVGATDVGEIAVLVARGDVTGVEVAARGCLGVALRIGEVSGHQVRRVLCQIHADLALVGLLSGDRVDEHDRAAGKRPAHRAVFDRLTGGVRDHCGHLGLTVPVADGEPPVGAHLGDDLGVERFARRDGLAQPAGTGGEVGLDQHPPDSGRCAERGDPLGADGLQHPIGVEPRVVVHEDRRLCDPGREEAAPRVLGPSGRADRQMNIARTQTQPVHRREVTDRVGDVCVLHELRATGRAGGEIVQQRVGRERAGVRHPIGRSAERLVVIGPSLWAVPDADAGHLLRQEGELVDMIPGCDHVRDRAALEAVLQVVAADRQRRGQDDRTDLGEREHRLPELDLIAEHQQDCVPLLDSSRPQPVPELVRARRHLVERPRHALTAFLDDHQGGRVISARDVVEPVDRPVERAVDLRPRELRERSRVVLAKLVKLIARGAETFGSRADRHGHSSSLKSRRMVFRSSPLPWPG